MDEANLITCQYPFEPTADQHRFCSKMAGFIRQDEVQRCFVLKGYAGTGKTTSVAALVKALPAFKMKIALLAPTGRAAKVMAAYSGKPASTIHKRIYRKRSAVSFEMAFQLAPNLAENTLFIVDEASMIDDEWNQHSGSSLLKDLIRFVYQSSPEGKNKNCFLMFVGDTAQLPPVGSLQSPALSDDYLHKQFHLEVSSVELKEVVRQEKQSGILANATMLRRMIARYDEQRLNLPHLKTASYNDLFVMTGARMTEGLEYAYGKYGIENTLVVCRSNKSANAYNNQVRSRLLYRDEVLTGGDQVMVVKNNYFWLPENPYTSFIANGDMAKVVRVRREEEKYGFRFVELSLEFLDYKELGQVSCKVILDTLQSDSPNLGFQDNKKIYEALLLDYGHITNKRKRMAAIKEDPYYNALQLKFSYAVTCHKAQGGQWDAVFVDQGYLTEENINLDFLRWLYTAVTRAKSELFLVNFSKKFFPGVIEDEF